MSVMNEKQTNFSPLSKQQGRKQQRRVHFQTKSSPVISLSPNQSAHETTVRPTKKQRELLTYIEAFITEHGYSPSYREIMNGLQYTSVATVALHISNLIKRGHLRKRTHSARSLEVITPLGTGVTAQIAIATNQVRPSDEKWLVDKIDHLFREAEANAVPVQRDVDDLAVMMAALRVLGLEGAMQSFRERFDVLRKTLET